MCEPGVVVGSTVGLEVLLAKPMSEEKRPHARHKNGGVPCLARDHFFLTEVGSKTHSKDSRRCYVQTIGGVWLFSSKAVRWR